LGTDHSFFFLCSLQFWVARRERASLLFFHDECDSHSLPKNWSLPATEFTTAQDVIEGIAALCDHDVTHGALPFLYWQLVGDRPLVDDSLQAVDSRALLVDFVNAAERQKVRIRFVISFALPLPTRTVSPRALSPNAEKLIKLDGDDADALQRGASSGKRAPPPPRGLLRQKSSSSLALTDAAPPPVLKRDKSASKIVILTEPTTPAPGDGLMSAALSTSTSLSTSERVCAACDTWLAGDVVAVARARHYHPACFACDICGRDLHLILRFQLVENRIACGDCSQRQSPPDSVPTARTVRPSSPPPPTAEAPQPQPPRARQQQLGSHRALFAQQQQQQQQQPPSN
jgi:hypothetical protein